MNDTKTPISIELALGIALTSRSAHEFLKLLKHPDLDNSYPQTSEEYLNYFLQNGRTQIIHDVYGFLCVEKETYPGKYYLWS